jgi:hypothetical protein
MILFGSKCWTLTKGKNEKNGYDRNAFPQSGRRIYRQMDHKRNELEKTEITDIKTIINPIKGNV